MTDAERVAREIFEEHIEPCFHARLHGHMVCYDCIRAAIAAALQARDRELNIAARHAVLQADEIARLKHSLQARDEEIGRMTKQLNACCAQRDGLQIRLYREWNDNRDDLKDYIVKLEHERDRLAERVMVVEGALREVEREALWLNTGTWNEAGASSVMKILLTIRAALAAPPAAPEEK
jgi:hypothetical protein